MRTQTTAEKIDFSDKVAVITGGAQGIGQGVCEAFAALGADVSVADLDLENAEETAQELEEAYDIDAIAVETDVSDYESASTMIETTIEKLGQVDLLINNAGIGESKPFVDTDPEDWDKIVGVCYYGTMNCTHAVLPHMIERKGGAIINFASDSYKGNDPGLAVYGGAKAANVSFTRTVSHEVGDHGIRVNCVSPGTTRTPATEEWVNEYEDQILESYALNKIGEPEDLADAIAFLCSDAADWITGEVLSVNGGYIRG